MLACACILQEEHERDDMTLFYSPPGTFFKKKIINSKAYALLPTLLVRCFLYGAEEHEDFCALSPRHVRLYFTCALYFTYALLPTLMMLYCTLLYV